MTRSGLNWKISRHGFSADTLQDRTYNCSTTGKTFRYNTLVCIRPGLHLQEHRKGNKHTRVR